MDTASLFVSESLRSANNPLVFAWRVGHRNSRSRWPLRLVIGFLAGLCMGGFSTARVVGQCTLSGAVSTWIDGNSNWNNGLNWSPNAVPNSASTSVCITHGSSTITLDINATVGDLQLASGNALNVQQGLMLAATGAVISGGSLTLSPTPGTQAIISVTGDFTNESGASLTFGSLTTFADSGNRVSVAGDFNNVGGAVTMPYFGFHNALSVGGTFNNNGGTLTMIGVDDTLSVGGDFNNNGGVLDAHVEQGGDFSIAGSFHNSGGVVTLGDCCSRVSVGGEFDNSGGTVTVFGGAESISVGGGFNNKGGALTLAGEGASISVGRDFNNSGGTLTLASGALGPSFSVGAAFNNGGTVTVSGQGSSFSVGRDFNNDGGTLTLASALGNSFAVGGAFKNNGGTVTVDGPPTGEFGFMTVDGTFAQNGSGSHTFVEGTVTAGSLDLEGGTYTNDTGVTDLGTVSGTPLSGSVNLGSNGVLTDNARVNVGTPNTQGTLNNAGIVGVGRAGTLTLLDSGSYTQTGGVTDVNGTLIAANVAINGGLLSGTGTVEGATTIGANAQLSPGFLGIGTMKFSGGPPQPALDVLGTWDQSIHFSWLFDTADINGQLALGTDSVLDIFLSPFYHPKVGTSVTVADFSSLSGTFGSILNDTFNNGKEDWLIAYNSTDIVLTAGRVDPAGDPPGDPPAGDPSAATPEPSSLMLIFLGIGALTLTRTFRRKPRRDLLGSNVGRPR